MFPIYTPEFVRAEQSYRLEGYRRWLRRHSDPLRSVGVEHTPPASRRRSVRARV
jgi:hypothetical protein